MICLRAGVRSCLFVLVAGFLQSAVAPLRALAQAAPSDRRQVSVQGQCFRQTTADRGAIIVTAEATDLDIRTANRRATESYEHFRDAVKRMNLENLDLRTVEFSVNELREWQKDRAVFKGFKARMGLRVATSQINKIGDVIAAAAREQIKDVGQLSTFLSDEKRMAEHLACLKDASENARTRAEKLATSLGAKLGDVISVTEEGAIPPPPRPVVMGSMMMKSARADGAEMAAPSVEGGSQDIAINIHVTFGLR